LLYCTDIQYVYLRHISYVFIVRKLPHKPSHIVQAYQNVLRDPIVEHKNTSIRKISLKNQYFKHIFSLKGAVQQINRKNRPSSIKLEKMILNTGNYLIAAIVAVLVVVVVVLARMLVETV
jgi:hypothetical protein